jgi:hypothetical protein
MSMETNREKCRRAAIERSIKGHSSDEEKI